MTPVSNSVYDVTARGGNLAGLNATVTLSLASGHDIVDSDGNALTNPMPSETNNNTFQVGKHRRRRTGGVRAGRGRESDGGGRGRRGCTELGRTVERRRSGGCRDRLRSRVVGGRRDGLDGRGPGPRRDGDRVRRHRARRRGDRHYRVRAVNDAGPGEWPAVVSATAAPDAPDAPENVSATASGASRIDVSWTAPEGEVTGYEVEWSADGETGWTGVDPAHGGTETGYSDTGLDGGTTRHYRVRAVNDAGPGEWSAVVSATAVPEAPEAPENVSATASGASRIDVSWTAPEGEVTGYEIEWSADGETRPRSRSPRPPAPSTTRRSARRPMPWPRRSPAHPAHPALP